LLVSLGPDWKQYKFITNGLNSPADKYVFAIYPGDVSANHGDVCVFAPQASEDESDYLPNPSASNRIDDLDAGNRFEKALNLTSVKTSTHSGSGTSGSSITAFSGLGAGGSAALESGSTDCAGVIVLTPGTDPAASGTVTLAYHQAYQGTMAPVVVATLEDATTPSWGVGSQVRVSKSSNHNCVLAWTNCPSLPLGGGKIAYFVIGRS
jgi:hypothetical protein